MPKMWINGELYEYKSTGKEYQQRYIDGTPVSEEYLNQLREYMGGALDAELVYTTEELEAYARQMEAQRKETKEEETKNAG